MHVAQKAGIGGGVLVLVLVMGGVIFIGYHFYKNNPKPFRFHYFKVCRIQSVSKTPPNILAHSGAPF